MNKENSVVVRPMEQKDLDAVAEIERLTFSIPWTRQDFADFIIRPDAVFLVAAIEYENEEGEEQAAKAETVAGYIGFYGIPNEGDITNVAVRNTFRKRGIGHLLVRALVRETLAREITRIFLEVRESNASAIRLYEDCGFRKVGMRKNYYDKPIENAAIMLRDEEENEDVHT